MSFVDKQTAIFECLKRAGGSEAQASDAIIVLDRDVTLISGTYCYHGISIEDPELFAKALRANNKEHLLPRVFETSLADGAFLGKGNLAARAELAKALPADELKAL